MFPQLGAPLGLFLASGTFWLLLHFVSPEVKRRNAEETIDIYAPLAGRMGMQEMREELEDLSFRELYPDAYRVVSERLTSLAERNHDLTADIERQLTKKLADRGIAATVKGRQKRPYSIWRKMERKSVGFEQLSDLFAFRVIVNGIQNHRVQFGENLLRQFAASSMDKCIGGNAVVRAGE